MSPTRESPGDGFDVLSDIEIELRRLQGEVNNQFDKNKAILEFATQAADRMEEAYAFGHFPDSAFLHYFLNWFSHEVEKTTIEDLSEIKRFARLALLCQNPVHRVSSINTYVFSALLSKNALEEAEYWLREGIKEDIPVQSVNCLSNLGVLHFEQEKYDDALLEFLLVYSSGYLWNLAEATFYLAHLVDNHNCRGNFLGSHLLMKVLSLSDSTYADKARDCLAGQCQMKSNSFSSSKLLSPIKRFGDSEYDIITGLRTELHDFFAQSLEGISPGNVFGHGVEWRNKPTSWWFDHVTESGISAEGFLEYISEKLTADCEALLIIYVAGLSAKPEPSALVGLSNCLSGMGISGALPWNELTYIGSSGLKFQEHPLFSSWLIDLHHSLSDSRSPNQKLLTHRSNVRNHLETWVSKEPYFGSAIEDAKYKVVPIYPSGLNGHLIDLYNFEYGGNHRLLLLEIIAREFLWQLSECLGGHRHLSDVNPEEICDSALKKVERITPEEFFHSETLIREVATFSKNRINEAAPDENPISIRANHIDLFGGLAIAIAQGDFDWALQTSGIFGKDFLRQTSEGIRDEDGFALSQLKLVWPLCWTRGATILKWDEESSFPFEIDWKQSGLSLSTDSELISRVMESGADLDGPLPRIITGNETESDLSILERMTDHDLSLALKSQRLTHDALGAMVIFAGPESLASLVTNPSVKDQSLPKSREQLLADSMEIAWLVAKNVTSSQEATESDSLRILTRGFIKTKNKRAAALFASSDKLSDENLRELALLGDELVAQSVLANPQASDETKALARIGM